MCRLDFTRLANASFFKRQKLYINIEIKRTLERLNFMNIRLFFTNKSQSSKYYIPEAHNSLSPYLLLSALSEMVICALSRV